MNRTGKYTIVESCNEQGTVTLREHPRNGTLHVVEYDDPGVQEELADLDAGSVVHLELRPVGRRSDAWRATAAKPTEVA